MMMSHRQYVLQVSVNYKHFTFMIESKGNAKEILLYFILIEYRFCYLVHYKNVRYNT